MINKISINLTAISFFVILMCCSKMDDQIKTKFTITFESGTENIFVFLPKPIEINAGEKIVDIPSLRSYKYTFAGWFTEKDGKGKELTSYLDITEDLTFYAK